MAQTQKRSVNGNRLKKQQATQPSPSNPTQARGSARLRSSRLDLLWMDDPVIKELRGGQARKTIDRMMLDPIIAGMIERAGLLFRAPEWTIEPPKDPSPLEESFTDFTRENFENVEGGWRNTVAEASEMLGPGFVLFETLFVRDGRNIGWSGFAPRDWRTIEGWEVDDATGRLTAAKQRLPGEQRLIDLEWWKILHFRTRPTAGRPEGRTMLRGAFLPWVDKQELRRIIKIGIRRDLTGVPKLEVPGRITTPDASDEEKAALSDAELLVKEFERDRREGLVLPHEENEDGSKSGWRFGLVQSGGRRSLNLEEILAHINREIAIAVIAEFMLVGIESTGSWSLHSDKTTMFARGTGAWLDIVGEYMMHRAIPVLQALNPRFAAARVPIVKHGDIEDVPLAEFGQSVSQLLSAGGLTPEPNLETALRSRWNLPDVQGEEEL